jgi:hypothetical protein
LFHPVSVLFCPCFGLFRQGICFVPYRCRSIHECIPISFRPGISLVLSRYLTCSIQVSILFHTESCSIQVSCIFPFRC